MHRDSPRPAPIGRPPLLAWAAVLLIAAVALGAVAFTRPAGPQAGYRQDVDLTYSAAGDAAVYDGGRLGTGDPIYLRLVRRIEVQVEYQVVADAIGRSGGTIALDARLSGADGWQRTVRVAEPVRFAGPRVGIVAQVDLAALERTLRQARARTGAQGSFWLDLVPRISADTVIDGESRALGASPAIGFRVGENVLVPEAGRTGTRGAPIRVSTSSQPRAEDGVAIAGLSIGVARARVVSLGLALGAMLFAGLGTLWRPRGRGRGRITDRRGRAPIEVDDAELLQPAVDVAGLEDLLDVAERYDRPLLHVETRVGHTYLVEDRGVRYRFGRTALLPMPEPRFVPDPLAASAAAEPAAAPVTGPVPEPASEPAAGPVPEPAPAPGSTPEPAPVAATAPEPAGRPRYDSFDEAFAAEFGAAAQDLHVQRSVPAIEVAADHDTTGRAHNPRHRRPVDLTESGPAEVAARGEWTAHAEPALRAGRPDPVEAALRAAVAAVPPPRRPPPADTATRYRVADQPGVAQLRSWLRT